MDEALLVLTLNYKKAHFLTNESGLSLETE